MTEEEKYMARCLQLARHGELTTAPNPMVGAVIVHGGRIIGEGWHRRYGGPHAEVNAIRSVKAADEGLLAEATIYVSLEPCSHYGKTPPCAELLISKGLRRVVVGCLDPNEKVAGRGIAMLREAGVEVTVGCLEEECRQLNRKFMTFHSLHRPYITLKWAESADGFIDRRRQSCADGPAVRFSTPWTQMLVHRLRATHEAILVGRRTWELDLPSLTTREWPGPSPKRIILTARGSLLTPQPPLPEPQQGSEWSHSASKRIVQTDEREENNPTTVSNLPLSGEPGGWQKNREGEMPSSLLVEGGAKTLQSFIDADLWDEAYIERTEAVLGDGVKAPEMKTDLKGRTVHVNFA
ncbi:MAG: bifunctional diaminohydroxyphosphoribosylaminopyrimidine deaminase/5-amino-6-(5-phosphoribosylamino)uracil reductase RibD [Bacteroidaceae bacterium]|nr:bifunctional diaminohydroxyphosphoribosylaminopyrimidine deaminase/5-amino-6-(5-phosphoribosylamino)uracil reductase RibD [Bacteroidaceae bacterium]